MILNLKDDKFAENEGSGKSPINGGKAGLVRNCTLTIQRKGADDKENAPKYKLIFTDEEGGEINRALFQLKPDASEGSVGFFVKEMNHLQGQLGFEVANGTADQVLDAVAKGVHENAKDKKFGVIVGFGTAAYPKKFLEVAGFWGYRNEDNITDAKPMKISATMLQIPLQATPAPTAAPTAQGVANGDWDTPTASTTDDLPF